MTDARLAMSFLGSYDVRWLGRPVRFPTNAARSLLAFLAVESDREHPREKLAAMLWPDRPQDSASVSLRQTLHRVRAALPDPESVLLVTRGALRIMPDAALVDSRRFEELIAECLVHGHGAEPACPACRGRRELAVALYGGAFLPSMGARRERPFDDWVLNQRDRLQLQAVDTLDALARAASHGGEHDAARGWAERSITLEPWREEPHRILMEAFTALRQRPAALAHYERCRLMLADELGVDPEPETVALRDRIRSGASSGESDQRRYDWGEAPAASRLFGRGHVLTLLRGWLIEECCTLVVVCGMGGVGKTALVGAVARELAGSFDRVVWRSMVNAPRPADLIRGVLSVLSGVQLQRLPHDQTELVEALLDVLSQRRCLLVLDNIESVLRSDRAGGWRDGYQAYGQLLIAAARRSQQSCLLLTSRERPADLDRLEPESAQVRVLGLDGLDVAAGRAMLAARGLPDRPDSLSVLSQHYSGNPLALRLVAQTVQDVFSGNVEAFLGDKAPIFDDIAVVLDEQFDRLPARERELLIWLAVCRDPIAVAALRAQLVDPPSPREFVETLRSLQRRCLLETVENGVALQNVIMEYVTERFVGDVCRAVHDGLTELLQQHSLVDPQAPEHVRESQSRMILEPVARRLVTALGHQAVNAALRRVLAAVRARPQRSGYAGGSVLNLLLLLGADLRSCDFSGLCVWRADLRGSTLAGVDLTGADLARSVFSETFGTPRSVALSVVGDWLAGGTDEGEIPLWRMTDGSPLAVLDGHDGQVLAIAASPDGTLLAGGGSDRTVRVYEIGTAVRHVLGGHDGSIRAIAFSPDGRLLATGGPQDAARLWDVETGACLTVLSGHGNWVCSLAFSPDGRRLAAGCYRVVQVWDVVSGELSAELDGHDDTIVDIAFSPDGAQLVSCGGSDHTIRVWDVSTGGQLCILSDFTNMVWALSFSPDGTLLATGSAERTIRLWDTATWQVRQTLHGHTDAIHSVAFGRSGHVLASASFDQTIRLWDGHAGRCLRVLRGHAQGVYGLAYSPDGAALASGRFDHTVRLWNVAEGAIDSVLLGHRETVTSVAFSPSGAWLATASTDQTVRIWDVRTRREQYLLHGHEREVSSVAFNPAGDLLASGGEDGTIRLWDVRRGQACGVLRGHSSWVNDLAFGPDGIVLFSASFDHTVRLWDVGTRAWLRTIEVGGGWVTSLALSPDGATLATGSQDGIVRLWDTDSGTVRRELPGHADGIYAMRFSPDGLMLASAGVDREVRLWDLREVRSEAITGGYPTEGHPTQGHAMSGHAGWVWSLAFHPDGHTLASASGDGTIKLWDPATKRCRETWSVTGPYTELDITGVTGISSAQRVALRRLGAIDRA